MKTKTFSSFGGILLAFVLALLPVVAKAAPNSGPANALVGQTADFTVKADGTQPFTYQWKKDGADLAGETTVKLTKANLQLADSGTYSVVISNSAGSTTATTVFTVTAPVLPPTNGGITSSVK